MEVVIINSVPCEIKTNAVIVEDINVSVDIKLETTQQKEELGLLSKEDKDEYAVKHEKLIYFTVKQFIGSGINFDELVSIATLGFAKALNKFDRDKGVKFSTYSIRCIRNEILYFLRKEKKHMRNLSFNKILSTDKNGNDLSLEATLEDSSVNIEESAIRDEHAIILRKAIQELNKNEIYIAIYRFGLDRGIVKTQAEIANEINMSQANVSKIEATVKEKLKEILTKKYKLSYQVS